MTRRSDPNPAYWEQYGPFQRTRAGMKAALEIGRWVFLAPLGYTNAPRAMGKSLLTDPQRAPLVRRPFEEYATGRFTKEQLLKQATAWGLTNRRERAGKEDVVDQTGIEPVTS